MKFSQGGRVLDAISCSFLAEVVSKQAQPSRPVLLCITGNSGCGKSTLAKHIRKQGLPGISPRQILVIDDGVASVDFLWLFRRRLKFRSKEKDHLEPFKPYFGGKKLVVFVSVHPGRRVDECDIQLTVDCDADLRRKQLAQRNADGEKRFMDTSAYVPVWLKSQIQLIASNDGRLFRIRDV